MFLGPQPSTYINATFIEGYDNSESFIITQDPLEETIGDFWRMISEQSINTIVMISEVSEFMVRTYISTTITIDLKLNNEFALNLIDWRWTDQMSTLLA